MKPTDDLARRLAEDAGAVDAPVDPALRRRIDAAVAAAPRRRARPERRPALLGWAAAAAGLAAVAVAILWQNAADDTVAPATVAATPLIVPRDLNFEQVALTAPLEQELVHLRTDLEKARRSIERDLRENL